MTSEGGLPSESDAGLPGMMGGRPADERRDSDEPGPGCSLVVVAHVGVALSLIRSQLSAGDYGPWPDYVEREVEKAHGVRMGADRDDDEGPPKQGPGCYWLVLSVVAVVAARSFFR